MAENMIKFLRGNVADLPSTATAGALYFTKDEGIYLGMDNGSYHRYGDFITVENVKALPEAGAHETCMYYCVAENILAKYDAVKGWQQINKQPTAEELKTLLGLGTMAYKSEVVENDLSADLKAKVNAAADGNHSHANKALLDAYTQTEADLADAVAKKHDHTFNETELNKITEGDVAKWNAVVADHLDSEDKTALENLIKEAKQAGTDANTNIESYKVTNDARVKAVEDNIAGITDGEGGILAQAKSYSDGKLAAARTEIAAEIDADVKVVADELAGYKSSNDTALAGVKATAEAAATKTYTDEELAKKVDKVEGKSLIADSEITRLAGVTNYDDTTVKADIAKKADAATMTTELGKKVDKVTGYSLVADDEIARLAEVDNYDDEEVRDLIGDNADAIGALADTIGEVAEGKTVVEMIAEAQEAATYDDTELAGKVAAIEADYLVEADKTALAGLITAEKERAEGIEGGLRTDVDAIKADYLKAADKKALQDQIDTIMNNPDTEGVINSINEFTQYIADHGTIAEGFRKDIDANAKAIADQATADAATFETKTDATAKLAEAKEYADGINTALDARLDVLEAIEHDAYVGADAALKAELQKEIDDDVKVVADNLAEYEEANDAAVALKANAADVYAKTETYTKEEVDAIVEAAHTWGEF